MPCSCFAISCGTSHCALIITTPLHTCYIGACKSPVHRSFLAAPPPRSIGHQFWGTHEYAEGVVHAHTQADIASQLPFECSRAESKTILSHKAPPASDIWIYLHVKLGSGSRDWKALSINKITIIMLTQLLLVYFWKIEGRNYVGVRHIPFESNHVRDN